MKSAALGNGTSAPIEILSVTAHGVWLIVDDREYFLSYVDFPWFKEARIGAILNVESPHTGHLYWPELDVDLAVRSLEDPAAFPLVAK
jgi:hypothetical protein